MAEKEFKIQNGLRVLEEAYFESTASISGALNVNTIVFEGATANDFETTLTVTDPTADRTITLPNATTTLVGADTTDTLSNKTLSSPLISGSVDFTNVNVIGLSAGGGGATIQDNGSNMDQRDNLNFVGFAVSDNSAGNATNINNYAGLMYAAVMFK